MKIGIYMDGAYYYYGYKECCEKYNCRITMNEFLDHLKKVIKSEQDFKDTPIEIPVRKYFNVKVSSKYCKHINILEEDLRKNKFEFIFGNINHAYKRG